MSYLRVAPSPETIAHSMPDGATLLVNMASSQIYEMNAPGSRFWTLVLDGRSVEEATSAMLEEFDVSPERLAKETESLLADLAEAGQAR